MIRSNEVNKVIPVRELAGVAGQVISMQSAVGMIIQLRTKEMFKCINSKASWNAPVIVSSAAELELEFWYKNVEKLNGTTISCLKSDCCTMFTDASGIGYGGYVCENMDLEKGRLLVRIRAEKQFLMERDTSSKQSIKIIWR